MRSFMLGKKAGMSQLFLEDGTAVPVTVIQAGPITVVQVKTKEHDGYNAVKVAYDEINKNKINKPENGLFVKTDISPKRYLVEFRVDSVEGYKVGDVIGVDALVEGNLVDVSGTSKGKGFAGIIKRHGYSTGPASHGSKHHRTIGAIAAATDPGKIAKGKKMPGHMGAEKVTVQNLKVMKVYKEQNAVLVKGAVPGPKGGLIVIQNAKNA